MTIETGTDKAGKARKTLTMYQKGRRWAFWTMVFTGLFSAFSNVRSGVLEAEPIAYSVFPMFILFVLIHLIGYYNPKSRLQKSLAYIGLSLSAIVAFGMSGYHIYEQALRNGQPFLIACSYPFVVDFPAVISALILAKKGASVQNKTNEEKTDEDVKPVKSTPASTNGTTKTTPAKTTKPAAKRATPAKSTKPSTKVPTPSFSTVVEDPAEISLLRDGASR